MRAGKYTCMYCYTYMCYLPVISVTSKLASPILPNTSVAVQTIVSRQILGVDFILRLNVPGSLSGYLNTSWSDPCEVQYPVHSYVTVKELIMSHLRLIQTAAVKGGPGMSALIDTWGSGMVALINLVSTFLHQYRLCSIYTHRLYSTCNRGLAYMYIIILFHLPVWG